jgi:hypothetical protein
MAKKFYEVQSHIMLTAHITDSLLTIVGGHVVSITYYGQRMLTAPPIVLLRGQSGT